MALKLTLVRSNWHPLLNRETAEQIKRWREEDRHVGIIWEHEREANDRAIKG